MFDLFPREGDHDALYTRVFASVVLYDIRALVVYPTSVSCQAIRSRFIVFCPHPPLWNVSCLRLIPESAEVKNVSILVTFAVTSCPTL